MRPNGKCLEARPGPASHLQGGPPKRFLTRQLGARIWSSFSIVAPPSYSSSPWARVPSFARPHGAWPAPSSVSGNAPSMWQCRVRRSGTAPPTPLPAPDQTKKNTCFLEQGHLVGTHTFERQRSPSYHRWAAKQTQSVVQVKMRRLFFCRVRAWRAASGPWLPGGGRQGHRGHQERRLEPETKARNMPRLSFLNCRHHK